MTNRFHYILILTLVALLGIASCQDDFPMGRDVMESGESLITATVDFKDFTPALDSRSSGTAMRDIRTLWVAIYKTDGTFVEFREITDFKHTTVPNKRPDGSITTESYTGRAEFSMVLRNGFYRIYAIANTDLTPLLDTNPTEDELRSLPLTWQAWTPNSDNTEKNAQMFGFFSQTKLENVPEDFVAPEVTVARNGILHAWVRRAASKVTVAFDTEDLYENIYVYIRSIRLVDIPKYCYLGRDNTPASDKEAQEAERYIGNDLIAGEHIFTSGSYRQTSVNDEIADRTKWLTLFRSDTVKGLIPALHTQMPSEVKALNRSQQLAWLRANQHSEKAPALYFYENRQPKGTPGTISDKRQDVNESESGDYAEVSYPDGVNPGNEAWKDARPYGSYLEVDGYYVSEDPSRPGRGPIKYRFMLGKNETDNFDAERNYHYRVTLKFNGYANDIDFHIEYDDEGKPGFITPPEAYVPYLYNQRTFLVARATPKKGYRLESVQAVIVKNEWRPHALPGESDAALRESSYYGAAWDLQMKETGTRDSRGIPNYTSSGGDKYYNTGYAKLVGEKSDFELDHLQGESPKKTDPNCAFGFLSLRNITEVDIDFGGGLDSDKTDMVYRMLYQYHYGKTGTSGPLGRMTYGRMPTGLTGPEGVDYKIDDKGTYYNVIVTDEKMSPNSKEEYDKTYILQLPLHTRAKSLDTWAVFSGANPFYQHYRKAVVRYMATFVNESNPNDKYTQTDETTVFQARRMDNPRGIYRRANNLEGFNVDCCYMLEDGKTFLPIDSRGEWSVTIEKDPYGIASLSKNGKIVSGEGATITGRTGSTVNFWYYPRKKLKKTECAGAILTVRYHRNTCVHKIIVRQGYKAIRLAPNGRYWSTFNLYDTKNLAKSPLSQGSLFKRVVNLSDTYPICESNNYRSGFGYLDHVDYDATFKVIGTTNKKWFNIPSKSIDDTRNAFGSFKMKRFDDVVTEYECPSYEEAYREVLTNNDTNFAFGIVYADGATATLKDENAYSFQDPDNLGDDLPAEMKKRGVRGLVVYSLATGNNTFFPFGALGHGRRRYWGVLADQRYGTLLYSSWHDVLNGSNSYPANYYRPLAHFIYKQYGALYWFRHSDTSHPSDGYYSCFDFNYSNYNTGALGHTQIYGGNTKSHSDALLIKPVSTEE